MIKPYISLSMKDYCIRIPRVTLSMLGNPTHVQLLFNPEKLQLAVRACTEGDLCAERIKEIVREGTNKRESFEMFSKLLVRSIAEICPVIKRGQSYRITGVLYDERLVTVYDINGAEIINEVIKDNKDA